MPARDLSAFQENDGLTYPGVRSTAHPDGATYTVASPDAATGLHLAKLGEIGFNAYVSPADADKAKLDDAEERSLYEMVLGPTLSEMTADGVPWAMVRRIAQDAFFYWAVNEQFADAILASQGEALALANRATRRKEAKAKKAGKASTTKPTARNTAGSKSSPASTPTRARIRQPRAATRATGPSSTSPNEPEGQVAATG